MENELKERRAEAIAGLENALWELESGEGLLTFVEGHGIQSRYFRFKWNEPLLEISCDLPTGRVLSGEETEKDDDAEAGAAIRMALILLRAMQDGKTEDAEWGRILVSCNESGAWYEILASDGSVVEKSDGWSGLVSRLERLVGDAAGELAIIWP